MAFGFILVILTPLLVLLIAYLWHLDRAMDGIPPEALRVRSKPWSTEQIQEAYRKALKSPTDVRQFLPAKKNRRYVVVGGSGLVGGWIVQHLLWRGEDPRAIRIMDLRAPTRPEIAEKNISFLSLDVSNSESVSRAFKESWPQSQSDLPLTVFHCVAYINAADRKEQFLDLYWKINVIGTQNVLEAAKATGASIFISTSSGSIGVKPPRFFLPPWQRWPTDFWQYLPNAEPPFAKGLDAPLEEFTSCYAFSKANAERIVRAADNKAAGFRTGSIRPGHAIYGAGVENPSSVTWGYLSHGGNATWLSQIVANFVDVENVSIAHLALENALLDSSVQDVGGRAYCCTDPGPPISYGHFYKLLITLAHPTTVPKFPNISPAPLLLLSYIFEAYSLLRAQYATFLPAITGDLAYVMPATFNVSTEHVLYDDSLARKEIGYKPARESLEGLCLALKDWNDRVERKLEKRPNR